MEQWVWQSLHEVLAADEMPLTDADRAGIAGTIAGEAHLRRTIDNVVGRAGRRVDEASPTVDARLPDGSRVNAIIPPRKCVHSMLTIRKYGTDSLTIDDLISSGTLSDPVTEFLGACVRGRVNIVVSGGRGAGKTTTLSALCGFIPDDDHIVAVEDAGELHLRQENVVRLESRPADREGRGEVKTPELIRNALRKRPDRIVVGEINDAAALTMLQAFCAGHDG